MKKEVLFGVLISLLIFTPFIIAQGETVEERGYECLEDKVNQTGCNRLSTQGKIFALLTLGECFSELLNDSNYMSDLKLTSQALFALENLANVDFNTTDVLNWIWSQNRTPTDFTWYLQIDSTESTTCTITYDSIDYNVDIGIDKRLSSDAGDCLTRASGDYWLEIDTDCYDKEFDISCGESTDSLTFLTNLLFTTADDNTIHVSSKSSTDNGGGTTSEKIEIGCFGTRGICDYEGSLWTMLILDNLDKYTKNDLSPYLFYLTSLYETNPAYLPESFLYSLTGESEYRDALLEKQTQSGFWKVGVDKFYDTALALLSPMPESSIQYQSALEWIEENQDSSGCWNRDNPTDTAFLLFSVWPRGVSLIDREAGDLPSEGEDGETGEDGEDGTDSEDCINQGYFCMSGINCQGTILSDYSCAGFDRCCSREEIIETCSILNGEVCNANQRCVSGSSEKTFDLDYGQVCCIGGSCENVGEGPSTSLTCVSNGGSCRFDNCLDTEQESIDTCEFGYTCCMPMTDEEKSYLWLWILILIVLIALVIFGITKRDMLRSFWFRIKSKFKKSPPPSSPQRRFAQGRMPTTPAATQRRIMQGRPSSERRMPMSPPPAKPRSSGEVSDVLNKLKRMGS